MAPHGKTILVVDDEVFIRTYLKQLLARDGHTMLVAGNAEEALEIVHSNNLDLVISDIVMPGVCGTDLAKAISREKPSVKILLMSGHPGEVDPTFAFIAKPFSPAAIRGVIGELVGGPASNSER